MSGNEMTITLVEPVIDHSLWLLSERTLPGDAAQGILAAIRRVRGALEESGGAPLVDLLDSAIRDRLIIRNLRRRRAGECPDAGRLPPGGPSLAIAQTIMVTAAETCMAYAENDPDVGGMLVVVLILLDRLIETMGEAPSHVELLESLRLTTAITRRHDGDIAFAAASVH
jgi:hypothetical protein